MEIQKALDELKALKIDYNLDLGINFEKAQAEINQALQLQQGGVSSSFVLFRIYGKDLKCWYGTHRNENQEFQKNIFSNYKLNAYRYTKEEAEKLSKELDCEFEVFVL